MTNQIIQKTIRLIDNEIIVTVAALVPIIFNLILKTFCHRVVDKNRANKG